jgi:hypothetical protein
MKYSELPHRYWVQSENGKWYSTARSNINARTDARLQTVQRGEADPLFRRVELPVSVEDVFSLPQQSLQRESQEAYRN